MSSLPPQHGSEPRGRVIVIGLDDSKPSTVAVDWAGSHLGITAHDQVHLVYVMPFEPVFGAATSALEAAGAGGSGIRLAAANDLIGEHEAQKVEARQCLHRMNAHFETQVYGRPQATNVHTESKSRCHEIVLEGSALGPGAEIVSYAKRVGADVIVVGSRGLGAVKRSLLGLVGLGSVSDYILHHAAVPVCVVPHTEG